MNEKGMKMIEASKYIKANGLYTKSKAEPKKRGRKPKSAMV